MAERVCPSRPARFLLNGQAVTAQTSPQRTVLAWLREDQGLTGTKEGCAEGDCGACTVVLAEAHDHDGLQLRAVNACIQLMPMLDGKALFTVEHLQTMSGALHPVQQSMVECHASQCGFCTPGFVMSLWAQYETHLSAGSRPSADQLRQALTGNLCRCTGYKPILDAGSRMLDVPAMALDREALAQSLAALNDSEDFCLESPGYAGSHPASPPAKTRFMAPASLTRLLAWRAAYPQARVLAGSTDIGLWVTKQLRELGDLLFIGRVPELQTLRDTGSALEIGAAVRLEDAFAALCQQHPECKELHERFASLPIRQSGTLGGNIANGSPIGDSMPALIALGAEIVLQSQRGMRQLPLEDFYLDYMKNDLAPDELVTHIRVPHRSAQQILRVYKLSKRHDSDISAVCMGVSLRLRQERIEEARVAFGGMAATVRRAVSVEKALENTDWQDEHTVLRAMDAITSDFQPLSDMRASSSYRLNMARQLMYRLWLETRPHQALPASATRVMAYADAQNQPMVQP